MIEPLDNHEQLQTLKVAEKVNELVEAFNNLAEETKEAFERFSENYGRNA